jgi:hypothetical protein
MDFFLENWTATIFLPVVLIGLLVLILLVRRMDRRR